MTAVIQDELYDFEELVNYLLYKNYFINYMNRNNRLAIDVHIFFCRVILIKLI